jgi:cytidylate kinase
MNTQIEVEKCLPFISSQMLPISHEIRPAQTESGFMVTLSRQTGCGAHAVAEKLAEFLQFCTPADSKPWAVFDRNLVERVLEEHHLPLRLARFMPEDKIPEFTDTLEEMLGAHPPARTLVRQTAETIEALAMRGNTIVVGRGANLIAAHQPKAFHVRLVGSLERRLERVQESQGLGKAEARELVLREDRGRKRYLKKYFDKDLDDPLLYHMVINTDKLPGEQIAAMIGAAVLDRMSLAAPPKNGAASASSVIFRPA